MKNSILLEKKLKFDRMYYEEHFKYLNKSIRIPQDLCEAFPKMENSITS